MTHTITAQDGTSDTTTPVSIVGFAPTVESANVIHPLIAPGQIAVTLVGDFPRSGSLRLRYDADADADAARLLLGRATAFVLTSSERPIVDMTFVRYGQMSPAMHNTIFGLWEFEVGYQEIVP